VPVVVVVVVVAAAARVKADCWPHIPLTIATNANIEEKLLECVKLN